MFCGGMELAGVLGIMSPALAVTEEAVNPKGEKAWEKAAACEAHARYTNDGKLQAMFRKLRDSWIRIANEAQLADDPDQSLSA
jgi:hypothetical protein